MADWAGHTDMTHHHFILHSMVACTGVDVLYKRSDLQETLLERLSQTILIFRARDQLMPF